MRAFRRVAVPRALNTTSTTTTLSSRALYTTYRASAPALGPLESRRGRVENVGVNDPALQPLKDAVSEKADQAKNAFNSAAHAAGADEAVSRASDAAGKIKQAAHDAEEKVMAPEVRKYPVEFSMATGAGVVGVGLMLWWMYMYMRPQGSIENETARLGGQGVEDAKKIVEAQKSSVKKL